MRWPKMSRKSNKAEIELRRKKVAVNLKSGLTYRQMAEAFNCSIGTIANDVKIILSRWEREQIQNADEWILLETARLDSALNAIWDDVLDGDLQAIDRMDKIMARRAKYLGLDSATKYQHEIHDVSKMSDDELRAIVEG